jgi:hypothetical protein
LKRQAVEAAIKEAPRASSRHRFVVKSVLGREVPLVTNGESAVVTSANVQEYCNLALHYRLNEFNKHVEAIREGLLHVVPLFTLQLSSWKVDFVCVRTHAPI